MTFPNTRWTLISQLADPEKVGAALDELCRAYWGPIYAYLRRAGRPHAEAQDLTQDFLLMVVRQRLLERADPVSGRLRSWLLAALGHFLANARRHETRQKRGAGERALPLDDQDVIAELEGIASQSLTPGETFDRVWASVLLRRVLETLRTQYRTAERENDFHALVPWLLDAGAVPQMDAATRAGMTVANFRTKLHRLRARYRETLRQEISQTLEREEDVPAELEYLFRVAGRPA